MEQERRAKKHLWLPLAVGAAGLATGLVIGGARAVKEVELSSEWEIDAPASDVFEHLLDRRNYAAWWPGVTGHATPKGRLITPGTVVQGKVRLSGAFLSFLPTLQVTVRFPQIEQNQRIRARLTGDVVGIAEWVLVPQGAGAGARGAAENAGTRFPQAPAAAGAGVVLKNNTRLRLRNPLLNLAVLLLPESSWRPHLEQMLLEVRVGLWSALEFATADVALSRP